MVKVRIKIPIFNDLQDNVKRKMGDVYITTDERGKQLEKFPYNGSTIQIAEIIEVIPEKTKQKEDVIEKPKKTRKKIDKKTK